MAEPLKVIMMGGRRCGKTSALASLFEEMKNAATVLSKDFPFVRVDFFLANNRFYFAELTFTPGAGMMPFNPTEFDLEWGSDLQLPNKI